MPVPIPGPEVGSDSQKVKFLMISGRPKTGFLDQISGVPGYIPPIPASYQPRSSARLSGISCLYIRPWIGPEVLSLYRIDFKVRRKKIEHHQVHLGYAQGPPPG